MGNVALKEGSHQRVVAATDDGRLPEEMVAVTIKGRVVKPLAAKQAPVVFKRQTSCTSYVTVGSGKVARSGAFTAKLPRPVGAQAAVYRGETMVPARKGAKKVSPTFTLPRAVGLG